MKKRKIIVAALIVAGVGILLTKKSKSNKGKDAPLPQSPKKNEDVVIEEEQDCMNTFRDGIDPLTDLRHRRALYAVARILNCDENTELGREEAEDFRIYFEKLKYSTEEEIRKEVLKVPEHSEEYGGRVARFYSLLGQSRNAFWRYSIESGKSYDELQPDFELIEELDAITSKWKL